MAQPHYHLEGIVHTRTEEMEDFEGPLDVILILLSKNKIEIQDVSITAILEQYLAYLDEMKRLDMEIASELENLYIQDKSLYFSLKREMDIQIYDLCGRLYISQKFPSGKHRITTLPKGNYILLGRRFMIGD